MTNIKCNVKKSIGIIVIGIFMLLICGFFAFADFRSFVDEPFFNNDIVYYFIKGFLIFSLVFLGFGLLILIRNVIFFSNGLIEIKEDYMIDRSSYISIGKIDINGENIYTSVNGVMSEDGQVINKEFSHKVKLSSGENVIRIKVTNAVGHKYEKKVIIKR